MTLVKKRWPLGVSVLVILVVLPAAWFVSGGMNQQIRESQRSEGERLLQQLKGLTVSYSLPAPFEGLEEIRESGVLPHEKRTSFFREQLELQDARIEEAVATIADFNQKGRGPLVEGLFPKEPADGTQAQLLRLQMQKLLVPDDDPGTQAAYEALVASLNATTPPEPQMVLERLRDEEQRLLEREQAKSGRSELTAEEADALQDELKEQRLNLYARRAQDHSIYMSLDVFSGELPTSAGLSFPRQALARPPLHATTWFWQYDYWLAEDVVGFLRLANTRNGELLPIVEAPIKRVVSLSAPPFDVTRTTMQDGVEVAGDVGPSPRTGVFEPRYVVSPSGRDPGWSNQLYDIRPVRMSLVVDSRRIPEILDATAQQNLITVTDLDVGPVDAWEHVEQGYFYGPAHVVQLDLQLEFIYLRSWTAPLMPDVIRTNLGMEPHPEEEPEDSGDGDGPR